MITAESESHLMSPLGSQHVLQLHTCNCDLQDTDEELRR